MTAGAGGNDITGNGSELPPLGAAAEADTVGGNLLGADVAAAGGAAVSPAGEADGAGVTGGTGSGRSVGASFGGSILADSDGLSAVGTGALPSGLPGSTLALSLFGGSVAAAGSSLPFNCWKPNGLS